MVARTCSTLLAVCLGLNVLLLPHAQSGSNDLRGEPFSLLGKPEPIAGDFFEGLWSAHSNPCARCRTMGSGGGRSRYHGVRAPALGSILIGSGYAFAVDSQVLLLNVFAISAWSG
jgi:hypothetical protein